jgi:hypothetical protein
MGIPQSRILILGILFFVTFLSGLGLTHFARPYNGFLSTIHKLVAMGAVIYLSVLVIKAHRVASFSGLEWAGLLTAELLFVLAIVTGAIAISVKVAPVALLAAHRIAPYVAVILTAATLWVSPLKAR